MIGIEKVICKKDCKYNKDTFSEGQIYYARYSMSSDQFLVKSNEGNLVQVINYTWAKSGLNSYRDNFGIVDWFLVKNKIELKEIGLI